MQYTEILPYEDFQKSYPQFAHRNAVSLEENNGKFCKVLRFKDVLLGTYALPQKEEPAKKLVFGFYLTAEKLILIGETDFLQKTAASIEESLADAPDSPARALFELFEFFLKDDILYLQEYETQLSAAENELLQDHRAGFDRRILKIRKHLSALSLYYQQLSDMGDTLCEQAAETGNEKNRQLFDLFCSKAKRLFSTVQMLKEYSMQLKELHQTQLDIKQNETMKILTIVTTLFMPLSLIAAWYGMNFAHMPELSFRYGYPIVCAVSAICLIAGIIFFKKKKWF